MKRNKIIQMLIVLLIIFNMSELMNEMKVKGAVTETGIIYDGNGNISKMLSNNKMAEISVDNSIIDIIVDGEKYGYYSTNSVATCVISDDDLLHIFWHTGHYYVYDLYESGCYILLGYNSVSGKNVSYYIVSDVSDNNIVKGTSTPNNGFRSCIIDRTYFYMYGQTMKKH